MNEIERIYAALETVKFRLKKRIIDIDMLDKPTPEDRAARDMCETVLNLMEENDL